MLHHHFIRIIKFWWLYSRCKFFFFDKKTLQCDNFEVDYSYKKTLQFFGSPHYWRKGLSYYSNMLLLFQFWEDNSVVSFYLSLSLYKLSIKNKTKQITLQLNYSTNFKPSFNPGRRVSPTWIVSREKVKVPARVTLSRCKQALMDYFHTTLLHYCEGNYGQN